MPHYCEYLLSPDDPDEPCGRPACAKVLGLWACANHYDSMIDSLRSAAEMGDIGARRLLRIFEQ